MGRKVGIIAVGRNGEALSYYESIAEAARMNGISDTAIHHAMTSGGMCHGIRWMREPEFREMWMQGRTSELEYSPGQIRSDVIRKIWEAMPKERRIQRCRNISEAKKRLVKSNPECMEAARKAHIRPVICITTGERFESIVAFARKYGLNRGTVTNNLRNGYRTNGMIIQYLDKWKGQG